MKNIVMIIIITIINNDNNISLLRSCMLHGHSWRSVIMTPALPGLPLHCSIISKNRFYPFTFHVGWVWHNIWIKVLPKNISAATYRTYPVLFSRKIDLCSSTKTVLPLVHAHNNDNNDTRSHAHAHARTPTHTHTCTMYVRRPDKETCNALYTAARKVGISFSGLFSRNNYDNMVYTW